VEPLNPLVVRAQSGDLDAFGRLVGATQTMAFATAVLPARSSRCYGIDDIRKVDVSNVA